MTRNVVFTSRAQKDLDELWGYIARHGGVDRAEGFVSDVQRSVRKLAAMPGMGHAHSQIPALYRVWSVHSCLIVYRLKGQTLIITRLVDGRRDLRKLFGS